jgi:hypothetical protein
MQLLAPVCLGAAVHTVVDIEIAHRNDPLQCERFVLIEAVKNTTTATSFQIGLCLIDGNVLYNSTLKFKQRLWFKLRSSH